MFRIQYTTVDEPGMILLNVVIKFSAAHFVANAISRYFPTGGCNE